MSRGPTVPRAVCAHTEHHAPSRTFRHVSARSEICPPVDIVVSACAAQLFNYSMDQFSQRLNTAGLASDLTLTSIAPVSGYTLEAQLRALTGTSSVVDSELAPAPAPSLESVAPQPSESAAPPPARYALGCAKRRMPTLTAQIPG